jgi:hypothetical protein
MDTGVSLAPTISTRIPENQIPAYIVVPPHMGLGVLFLLVDTMSMDTGIINV